MAREVAQLEEGERIRRWRRGQCLAEERQRSLRAAEGPKPAQAVAESLSALNALDAMGLWPGPLDPLSKQRVQEVRRRWARVQRHARDHAIGLHIDERPALTKGIARVIARFQADIRRLARGVLRRELIRILATLPMPVVMLETLGNKLGVAWFPEMLEVHHQSRPAIKTARLASNRANGQPIRKKK